jgi:hypothetical protein
MLSATVCLGRFSTFEADAQSIVLECLISGDQRSEMLLVDPNRKSIRAGTRTIEAEVSTDDIMWKEDGTIRVINRRTGAVLHRLPDESFFQIGQCHSSKKKF